MQREGSWESEQQQQRAELAKQNEQVTVAKKHRVNRLNLLRCLAQQTVDVLFPILFYLGSL